VSTVRPTLSGPIRPQIVAHRGASDVEPEHTVAAYRRAIAEGADALECDVRLTADGHLVCVHDRRVDRTSNGRGLVSTLELAELERLDWGSWKAAVAAGVPGPLGPSGPPSGPPAGPAGASGTPSGEPAERSRLTTLRQLLDLIRDAGRPLQVAVETKHPTRYAGQVERTLVDVLREFSWAPSPDPSRTGPARRSRSGDREEIHQASGGAAQAGGESRRPAPGAPPVRVMSFSALALRRMRQLAPAVPLSFLVELPLPVSLIEGSAPPGAAIGMDLRLVRERPRLAERLREQGRDLHVWVVDEPDDVLRCLDLGVSALITNRPAAVRAQLDALGLPR
jgi:glycerophosphoryl diester phosphodiesterase